MTSVIRVKRRIEDDPAEALRLSCKRRREADTDKPSSEIEIESVFAFVGTLNSKDEPVSTHIHKAIRNHKLHKELHPHSSDYAKESANRASVTNKLRVEKESSSKQNRYKITCSRRALEITELDNVKEESSGVTSEDVSPSDSSERLNDKSPSDEDSDKSSNHDNANKENKSFCESTPTPQKISENIASSLLQKSGCIQSSCCKDLSKENDMLTGASSSEDIVKEDKMFCIFDVETEETDPLEQAIQSSNSGITLNNVPLVSTKAPLAESEYVYDLYYTHSNLSEVDMDAVLTVQSLCDDLVCEENRDTENDNYVYEDDADDSNDEDNWRNDYPDEDPHFFENENVDYDYSEGMLDSNVLDDDSDLLSYWMDKRCRVGMDSDEDNDGDDYGKEGGSSDSDDLDY